VVDGLDGLDGLDGWGCADGNGLLEGSWLPVIVYDLLVFDRAQEINRRWDSIITHRLEV
jgi:hypothetical protein